MRYIWQGVYKTFKEVPEKGKGFNSQEWIKKSLKKINILKKIYEKGIYIPVYKESFLPLIAVLTFYQEGQVNVLDFGGSLGFSYYQLKYNLPKTNKFSFHIVETKEVCEAGKEFFRHESNIFFHSNLIQIKKIKFNIIHLGSSLQYIEKWEKLLIQLAYFQVKYILFTDLPAGNIPTFATVQNYYNSKIPAWFFNLKTIIKKLNKLNYKLIYKSKYQAKIFGREVENLPLKNFSSQYRIKYSISLLFVQSY